MTSPSPSEPRTASLYHAALAPAAAVKLVLATLGAWLVAMVIIAAVRVPMSVGIDLVGLVPIAITVGYARTRKLPLASIGLRWPHPRFLIAAVLIGSSAWLINVVLWSWVEEHTSTEYLHRAIDLPPAVLVFLGAAVVAPIGEELVFRGVLARGLATRLPASAAIAISAAVFSLYHLALPQLGPAFTIGLALAFVALRADSIIPSIVVHMINNAIVIALSRPDIPDFSWLIAAYPLPALGVALLLTGGGLALAARRPAANADLVV